MVSRIEFDRDRPGPTGPRRPVRIRADQRGRRARPHGAPGGAQRDGAAGAADGPAAPAAHAGARPLADAPARAPATHRLAAAPSPTTAPAIPAGCLFVDVCVQRDPFGPFVQDLVRRGAASGFRDSSFRPNDPVTRGQLAKMATLAAGFDLTTLSGPHFSDTPPTDPFYAYIETAFAQGLMTGYGDGTFRPQSAVTRGQMAKAMVLTRGWPLFDPDAPSFADVPYGTPFYLYVETASGLKVINSFADALSPVPDGDMPDAAVIDVALATFRPGLRVNLGGHEPAAFGGGAAGPYNIGAMTGDSERVDEWDEQRAPPPTAAPAFP